MVKFFILVSIIALSTGWLYILHRLAPTVYDKDVIIEQITLPSSLEDMQMVASALKTYSVNHWWYVLLIFSSVYIYKQAFCIPGSLFLNMLAGALYGNLGGLLFACIFTATGASVCYILSKIFAKELILYYFLEKSKHLQEKVKENEDRLLYFMLFVRLISVTPGWLINITAPLVGIPLKTFYVSTLIGLGPYNFVGVSAGGMLSNLKSVNDILSWKVLFNISLLGIICLGPALFFKSKIEIEKVKGS